jgi:NADP-dependent 3-hydroxy acid dehydrogenase YdfG
MNLNSKHIVITGASSGVGAALARQLVAQSPRRISLFGRTLERLRDVRLALEDHVACDLYVGDLSDWQFVRESFAAIAAFEPTIDALVSNAGLGKFGVFEEVGLEADMAMINANFIGMANVMRAALPCMKAQGHGAIVVTASDVSKRPISGGVTYCATKYAQEGMLASLRKEVRPHGIKVSGVYSGLVATPFHGSLGAEATTWLQPEDVASSILYVLSVPDHVVIDEIMIHPVSQDY